VSQPWRRRLGLALIGAGLLLLLTAGADKGLAAFRQAQLRRQAVALFGPEPPPAGADGGLRRLGGHLDGAAPGGAQAMAADPAAPGGARAMAADPAAAPGGAPGATAADPPVPPGDPLPPESGPLVRYDPLQPAMPLFRLLIPSINVENVVVEGSTEAALRLGPGHLEGTALPGEPGNVVLVGHRDYFFWRLGDLEVGDPVYVQARRGFVLYRVSDRQVVKDTDTWVTAPTRPQTLTLITCYPLIHPGYTDQRLVVFARRVGPGA